MKKALFLSAVAALMVVAGCSKTDPSKTTTNTSTPTSQSSSSEPGVIPQSLSVTTLPKTEYKVGEIFTVEGGVVTVTYSDEATQTFQLTDEMVPSVPSTAVPGEHIAVNVSYLGLTTKYYINVVDKVTPTIAISCNGDVLDLSENHWTKGSPADSLYLSDEVPTMSYTISNDLTATVSYIVVDADEQEIYNDSTLPSPLLEGTYTYKVSFAETADYKHVSQYALFKVTLKTYPTLTFSYGGHDLDLSTSHWVESASKVYCPSELPNVEYTVTPTVGANVSYVVKDDNEQEIYSGTSLPDPIVAGIYVMTVTTVETDDYLPVSNYVLFKMTDQEKVTPTLTLYCNSEALDLSSSHWTKGSPAASMYSSAEMPTLTYTISDSLTATESWVVTDSNTEAELYSGDTLPSPLITGTYCYRVSYAGSDDFKPVSNYALFQVTVSSQVTPTVQIIYDGAVLSFTTPAHWLSNEGWPQSKISRDDFKNKLNWQVVYNDSPVTVGCDTQIEVETVVQPGWEIDTCAAGTYTLRVTSLETEDYFSASNYVTFTIED